MATRVEHIGLAGRIQEQVQQMAELRQGLVATGTLLMLTVVVFAWLGRKGRLLAAGTEQKQGLREQELAKTDPDLLAKFSSYKAYQTANAFYPRIRVFYKAHNQAAKLPQSPPLPLLVFLHGLGGSLSQFNLLLASLTCNSHCLGFDLPGCGLSSFQPHQWSAYSYEALVSLSAKIIEDHCLIEQGQKVILIAHSLGCLLSCTIASRSGSAYTFDVAGVAAICPPAKHITLPTKLILWPLLSVPTAIFDIWRDYDKRGGIRSPSVDRMVGEAADDDTRELQLRYNNESQSPVWRRFTWGVVNGKIPLSQDWMALPISMPILLIGAENDTATPLAELYRIRDAMVSEVRHRAVTTKILPGSHALPYDHKHYRSVSGYIAKFLSSIDERLDSSWQLQHLTKSGKWDVKNYEKWKAIEPLSKPIGRPPTLFRAMKTLRDKDGEVHSSTHFTSEWRDKIKVVIDISHDSPVYDHRSLDAGGIQYVKFPTVSKYPPESEVKNFITLVDRLRANIPDDSSSPRQIGVHCHYGFNRTGFLIVAYLVEREGYDVDEALEEFASKRHPGIRHEHFKNTLAARYSRRNA